MSQERKLHEICPIHESPPSKKRNSDISINGTLPTEIRVEIAKNKLHMKEEEYNNTYKSCCLGKTDKRLCEYIVQAVIGGGIILFCAYNLTYNSHCESDPVFWSMMSSTVSHFLTKKTMSNKK